MRNLVGPHHVWVTNGNGNAVTEPIASTGSVIQTIGVGTTPYGASSDGTDPVTTLNGKKTVAIDQFSGI